MPTTISNGYSYEYQNLVRDLSGVFSQMIASYPFFISLVKMGSPAINTKVEWLEDSLSPTQTTIASFDTDGDGTGVNVVSTAGMRAGALLRFTTAADVSRTEICKIDSVDSATDLTLTRDYGASTGVTLVVGDKVHLVSSPLNEKTTASAQAGQEPDVAYNYTEIFERTADISGTSQAIKIYGLEDALDYQVQNKMKEIMWEMNSAAIYGRRVVRAAAENGSMGGILQFMESGNITAVGGAIGESDINDALEDIFEDGGYSNNYVILCSENQARRISAFNTAGSNPMVIDQRSDDMTYGHYISKFVGDLPVQKGFTANIVVDPNFLKDQVAIIDMNSLELRPIVGRNLQDFDATTPGMDGYARRILGEYTLVVKNGTKAHALLTGLTV